MKNRSENSILKNRLIRVAFLTLFIFLIFQLKNYSEFIEKYYTLRTYPFIRQNLLIAFNWIPFSIGDILIVAGIFTIILTFIRLFSLVFIRKNFPSALQAFIKLIITLEITLIIFYLFWGLNYFREPVAERLDISENSYTNAELIEVGTMLIDSANSKRAKLKSEDFERSNDEIYNISSLAALKFLKVGENFWLSEPRVKSSLLGSAMNFIGTAGYFNPFTGEAQVNSQMPIHLRPFVACHEIAHQSGVAGEDEANFMGFVMGIGSGDELLQYSTYYLTMQEFMSEIRRTDSLAFKSLKSKISEPVLADLKTESQYWSRYRGITSKLSSLFYDNYLKANNQEAGLKSYNKMVILSMAYYKRQGKFKQTGDLFP